MQLKLFKINQDLLILKKLKLLNKQVNLIILLNIIIIIIDKYIQKLIQNKLLFKWKQQNQIQIN